MELVFGSIVFLLLAAACIIAVFIVVLLAKKAGFGAENASAESIYSYFPGISGLKNPLLIRFGIVAVLVILMSIPLNMVSEIVQERNMQYHSVLNDIAATWGRRQTISGPVLLVPYTEKYTTIEEKYDADGKMLKVKKIHQSSHTAIILPETIKMDVKLHEQHRHRGIYKALVYTADLNISGRFTRPEIEELSKTLAEIHWDKAWLSMGISDTRAINKVSQLICLQKKVDFEPGTKVPDLIKSGFHAPLSITPGPDGYQFAFSVNINGSNGFYFEPFGKTTTVKVNSDWPHPSFQGSVLPEQNKITKNGFSAKWSIPHLARNYPQLWTVDKHDFDLHEFSAGINLFEPVSLYSKVTRAIKYAILFIALTYVTFLIFELGIKKRLHIVQYAIIGFALSLFYLSLLSMAEHIMFLPAYIISAAIIVILISGYVFAVIHNLRRTGLIGALLTGLYAILYSLLQLEDYALLAGTILLLIVLSVMMALTRNMGANPESTEAVISA